MIRDKDSSETVAIVAPQADVPGYISSTDLPALQAQPGFKLVKQDTVKVGGQRYVHLVYHLPAPPDPVTGKQVPSVRGPLLRPGPERARDRQPFDARRASTTSTRSAR